MDSLLPVDLISRWLHIGSVILLVGGSAFMRFALIPAAEQLPDETHRELKLAVLSRWRKYVGIGIGLILISGLYNFVRAIPLHKGQGLYHGLIGTKILLALVLFFLASALTGRAEKFEPIRQNAKKWLSVMLLIAYLIVGISGYAKVALPGLPPEEVVQNETAPAK